MQLQLKSIQRLRTGIAALTLALGLVGCASAGNFVAPIEQFATATDAATTALKAVDESATKRLMAIALAEGLKAPRRIEPSTDDDCKTSDRAQRCILIVTLADSTRIPLNTKSLIPNSARVMSGLQLYGHALHDIATADESEAVRAGLEKSVNAVSSIAGVFGLSVGAVLTPLTEAAVFGFQQYQNSVKLDALQQATKAADPVIKEAMTKLAQEARLAQTGTLARLSREYNAAFGAFDRDASETNIMTLLAAASRFDAMLTVKTSNVFTNVADAHAALTRELQDPRPSFVDVLAAVDAVLTEARNIQDVMNAFQVANR